MSLGETLVPGFIRRSLLVKLLLAIATIMLLTGLVGLFFYQGISSDLENQVDRQVNKTAVQHEVTYTQWIDNRQDNLESLLDNFANEQENTTVYRRLPAEEFTSYLDSPGQWQQVPELQAGFDKPQLHYVNTQSGEVVASSNPDFIGANVLDENNGITEAEISQGRFVVPGKYPSVAGPDVTAVGVRDPNNRFRMIIAEIHSSAASPELEHPIEGGQTGIVTGAGEHVIGHEPAIATQPELGEGTTIVTDGDSIYTYRLLSDLPDQEANFYIVTQTPKSNAFELRDAVLRNFGLTLVIAFVILIIGMLAGGRSVVSGINTLAKRAEAMGEGDLDVNLETNRVDEIGVLYEEFDGMRTDLKARIRESEEARKEAESARKEAEVARAEAEELATYLQEKAEEYSGIMQEVGMGDLTQRMTQDGEVESMDHIATEFNDMIEELEKTTGQLKSYVDEVERAGAEVEQSADTVREASEQVADSIQKISDDAYNQKEHLQKISETMDMVTDDLQELADEHDDVAIDEPLDRIRDIASDISDIVELSEETMAESQHVAGAAEEQAAELNEVSERANDLQRYAQPLRDILERFETEAEHEFVFSVGPTGGAESPGGRDRDDES